MPLDEKRALIDFISLVSLKEILYLLFTNIPYEIKREIGN